MFDFQFLRSRAGSNAIRREFVLEPDPGFVPGVDRWGRVLHQAADLAERIGDWVEREGLASSIRSIGHRPAPGGAVPYRVVISAEPEFFDRLERSPFAGSMSPADAGDGPAPR